MLLTRSRSTVIGRALVGRPRRRVATERGLLSLPVQGQFTLRTAFSREPPYKPDGGKIYVQDLIWEDRAQVADAILNGKGYVYICGDAKNMSKSVEETLARVLGEAKGGSAEVEGAAELKLLKERSRLMLDVWS